MESIKRNGLEASQSAENKPEMVGPEAAEDKEENTKEIITRVIDSTLSLMAELGIDLNQCDLEKTRAKMEEPLVALAAGFDVFLKEHPEKLEELTSYYLKKNLVLFGPDYYLVTDEQRPKIKTNMDFFTEIGDWSRNLTQAVDVSEINNKVMYHALIGSSRNGDGGLEFDFEVPVWREKQLARQKAAEVEGDEAAAAAAKHNLELLTGADSVRDFIDRSFQKRFKVSKTGE